MIHIDFMHKDLYRNLKKTVCVSQTHTSQIYVLVKLILVRVYSLQYSLCDALNLGN